jgi:hypothetical protein
MNHQLSSEYSIFATNSPVMPVEFRDQDVRGPKKLYRVRQ